MSSPSRGHTWPTLPHPFVSARTGSTGRFPSFPHIAHVDDQIRLEDVEGGERPRRDLAPGANPLSAATASTLGFESGISHLAPSPPLDLFGGDLRGDDSAVLQASGSPEIPFEGAHRAVGFDSAVGAGNLTLGENTAIYRAGPLIATIPVRIPPTGYSFVACEHAAAGIASVTISGTTHTPGGSSPIKVDNSLGTTREHRFARRDGAGIRIPVAEDLVKAGNFPCWGATRG